MPSAPLLAGRLDGDLGGEFAALASKLALLVNHLHLRAPCDPRHSHVSRWAQPRLVGALPILARPAKCSPAFFLGCARPIPSLGNGLNMASWGDVERGVSPDVRLRPAFYSSDDFRAWPRLGCRGTRTGATKHATRGTPMERANP